VGRHDWGEHVAVLVDRLGRHQGGATPCTELPLRAGGKIVDPNGQFVE
jgi:hypothetical protein